MKTALKILLSCIPLAGVGCSDSSDSSASSGDSGAATSAEGDDAGVTATGDAGSAGPSLNEGYQKATWAAGVTVTFGDCTIRYQSNGIPNHARDAEYALPNAGAMGASAATAHAAADPTVAQSYDITLSTCPVKQSTSTASSLGNIGYMISGASLFNPFEGDGTTVALSNNFSVAGSSGDPVYFVDSCNAHPTPNGQYHYHGLPPCVTAAVDDASGPSHLIGIAIDGFPVYGNRDVGGNEVTASQLDECNGITSPTPEFPDGVYHYVLPNTTDATSSIRCYKGPVAAAGSSGMPGGPPGGGMGPPPGAMDARTSSPCGTDGALALRDPSRTGRLWAGIAQSFRDPWSIF